MLTTSASRTLTRASASRLALAPRSRLVGPRTYASAPVPPPPAHETTKPSARPGPPPPEKGANPLLIVGGAAALAG